MIKRHLACLVLLLGAAAAPLAAQDSTVAPPRPRAALPPAPGALSLQETISVAQSRGHQARAARATRDASRYRGAAFSSGLLPQLSLGGTVPAYNSSIVPVIQPDGSTLFRTQQQTNASLALQLTQRLPLTGGSLFMQSSLARYQLTGSQSLETWSSSPLVIGLRQDIFRPNTLAWDRREQNVRTERDERAYLEAQEDIALQTTDLFFNVYAARTALRNAVANAGTNDTLYRLNTGRFQVGRIGENDLLQSELALLRSRSALEGAQLEYARATAALRIQLGLPIGTPLDVAMTATIPVIEADTAKAVSEALRNRAAVSDAALSIVQARRGITEARLRTGVGATVQASYGYNASGGAMRDVYQNLLDAKQFSVAVSVPLWQWGAHGENVRAAESDRDRATALSEATMEQLGQDAHFAALQLSQARRTVALLATADSVAGRRFDVAYNRYVIGRITIDNLYIAQTEKDAALQQFVDGLRRYWQSYYRLRLVTLYDFEANRPIR